MGRNEHGMFFHNPMDAIDADDMALPVFKIGPDPAVAPEGMIGLDGHDQGE